MKAKLEQFLRAALLLAAAALPTLAAPTAATTPFRGWRTQAEVIRHVLRALETGEEQELLRYSITGVEYRRIVWPELPVAGTNSTHLYELVWRPHDLHNRAALPRPVRL